MRALMVYESMYGNTQTVATDIAAGLSATHEVTVVPVTRATASRRRGRPDSRRGPDAHARNAHRHHPAEGGRNGQPAGGRADPGPGRRRPGHARLAGAARTRGVPAASFDTRLSGPPALTGRATRGISRLLPGAAAPGPPAGKLPCQQPEHADHWRGRPAPARGALLGEAADVAPVAGPRSFG